MNPRFLRLAGRLRPSPPRTLRAQLLTRSLIILAGILLVVGIVQYLFMHQFLYSNKAETMRSQLSSIPRGIWDLYQDEDGRNGPVGGGPGGGGGGGPLFLLPDASISIYGIDGSFRVLLQDPESGVVRLTDASYAAALGQPPKGPRNPYEVVRDDEGNEQLVVLQPIEFRGQTFGVAQLSMRTAPFQEELMKQLLLFLALAAAALALGLAAFLPIIRRTLDPLARMIATVEQIDSGSLNERLPVLGQAEIDRLAASFNRMMERLETSFEAEREAKEQMRRFVADASHELRTPLTSIHGFLEVLLRGAASQPEQLDRALRSMYSEAGRLNKLVRDLLLLARLDRSPEVSLQEGSLGELTKEMEPHLRMLAGDRGVTFRVDAEPLARLDVDKMKQVVLNLFQNAVQHTDPKDGEIAVTVERVDDGVALRVKDNGSGMDTVHLQRIFDRFYRADASRSRMHGGAGLGLSITKTIVDLHGGYILVGSAPGAGSEFSVVLPEAK